MFIYLSNLKFIIMKIRVKLFFVGIICSIASSAMAQSIQVLDKSGNDVGGTVINVWDDTSKVISVYFDLKNISGSTIYCKAKKIENNLLSGSKVSMCFAGHCYLSNTFITPNQDTILPDSLDKTFTGDYNVNGNIGMSIITFVFFRTNNPSDSAFVTVQFNGTGVGLNAINNEVFEISNPYPNPASSHTSFNYSFSENTSASFTLSDITGNIIREIPIYNTQGVLDVSTNDISEGIYFYSFYMDGKMLMTKKLLIQ
jgi:hypothetical protein